MKFSKNILLASAIFISLFFINPFESFSQECTDDCTITETVEIPIDNTPEVENFPPAQEPTQVNCGTGYFSDYYRECMRTCPGNSPDVRINESCPVAPVNNPTSPATNQPTPTSPVWNTNTPYQTPPINPNNNNGGVSITCRGNGDCGVGVNWGGVNVSYNPSPTTQTTPTNGGYTYTPTRWGGVSGPTQTYNQPITYNTPVITLPNPPRIVCPINYTVNGQECIPNKKTCIDGSQVSFFEQCTKTCWSGTLAGQKIPENQSCPTGTNVQSNPGQTYNPPIIYNNPVRPITSTTFVPTNWGAVSGSAQTYATNTNTYNTNVTLTKVCLDGNTVYDYQTCTKVCTDGKVINENYRCPAIQSNHQVITTNANYVTSDSARCNGVADIVNRVNTTGYFEYGTSASLGKSTNSGNIGYGDDISYSNTITNLSPDTKYYCRAVIVNKDGAYKGDIVSFRTSSIKKVYVSNVIEQVTKKEIISTPVKKGVVKKVEQKKVEVTCKDSEGNTDKLEAGEKFLDMRLENVSGFISPSEITNYKLGYKNRSNIKLNDLLIKIKIPEGMTFISSTDGEVEGDEIIIRSDNLKANEDYVVDFKLKADKSLKTGKNIIVQSNATYEMLDENGDILSDEASVYSISTVTDKAVNLNNKISKETESFWSGWLFKFLLSLILLVILFVLGRNIYKKIMHKKHADRILGHH